jgi:signal transduction histidine kinase
MQSSVPDAWKVLIVDDDEDVHTITRMALDHFSFADRPLEFLSAHSAGEAQTVLRSNRDTAVMFLDVVMESNHAGLDFVHFVREELGNEDVRIILRTGQPGEAPEERVVRDYDINDYREKTELTARRLVTVMYSALRSYLQIIQLRDAEQRALAASHAKSKFISSISHEFRTPLNAISGLSEIMYSEMYGPLGNARYKEYCWDIKTSSDSLLTRVEEVLEIAEQTSGTPPTLNPETFNIAAVITECLRKLSLPANESGQNGERQLLVRADKDAVRKMIFNLMSNAVKHGTQNGDIRVTARIRKNGELAISIIDKGSGIDAEVLRAIGDPFTVEGSAYVAGNQGIGLGFAITKSLIERHNGRLEIESVAGKGTTARLIFPPESVVRGPAA